VLVARRRPPTTGAVEAHHRRGPLPVLAANQHPRRHPDEAAAGRAGAATTANAVFSLSVSRDKSSSAMNVLESRPETRSVCLVRNQAARSCGALSHLGVGSVIVAGP